MAVSRDGEEDPRCIETVTCPIDINPWPRSTFYDKASSIVFPVHSWRFFLSFFFELHPSTTHPHARAFIHFAPYHLHVHCYLCFPLIFHSGIIYLHWPVIFSFRPEPKYYSPISIPIDLARFALWSSWCILVKTFWLLAILLLLCPPCHLLAVVA